jgi:hypothetical protein
MNERIREFAEQAFIVTTGGNIEYANEYMIENFAELIIKECAYINFYKRTDISLKDAYRVSQVILEHFGVEE